MPNLLRPVLHEPIDQRKLLSDVGEELRDGVPGQRDAGMKHGKEGARVSLLKLIVLHVGIAYPEHCHGIELHCVVMGIDLIKLRNHVGEEILAEPGVGPVEKGRSHRRRILLFLFDGDVFPVYDVTDRRSVDRPVLAVHVPASDPLLHSVVACGCHVDDGVGRPFDGQDLLRYGHIRSPPFLSFIIS